MRRVLAFIACGALLAGCGGAERQDADEPSGTYELEVARATFPSTLGLSEDGRLTIAVRNTGDETAPHVAVTLEGLTREDDQSGLADPTRPVFIVDDSPRNGDTAYVETWAFGPLPAGGTREFHWRLTPVLAGSHTISYTVAAGLDGRAQSQTAAGDPATGSISVRVDGTPAQESVDPSTGDVER